MKKITLAYDEIKHETDDAYLIVFGEKTCWLPKSQVNVFFTGDQDVEMPLWLAEEKEIEAYEVYGG